MVFDNLTTGFDWAVPSGARLIGGDIGDQLRVGALIAAHRIDAIIHFAPRSSCLTRSVIHSAATATTRLTPAP